MRISGLLLIALVQPLAAQSKPEKGWLIGGGLSLLNEAGTTAPGVLADARYNFKQADKVGIGVVGTLGFNHFGSGGGTDMTLMGGLRATLKTGEGRVMPYGQFQFGIQHCFCGFTDKIAVPGIGVDIGMNHGWNLRGWFNYRFILDPTHSWDIGFGVSKYLRGDYYVVR